MFFSLQTVVIVNTEQPVVLEITWRSNKWSVIRLHQWHSVTCGDMWWPRGSSDHSDMSHLMRLGRDDCQLWCWSDHRPLTRLPGEDIRTLSGLLSPSSLSLSPVIDTAQSDEQACDFQNWPKIIWKRSLPVWSPMNCLGIYLCTVWDEYCAIGIGCRVY